MKCDTCRSGWIFCCTTDENGLHHSYNNKPSVVRMGQKDKEWHKHGKLHREDGPAVIYDRSEISNQFYFLGEIAFKREKLYIGKTIQKDGKTALVIEKINNLFYRILLGDEKKLVVSLDKYKEA